MTIVESIAAVDAALDAIQSTPEYRELADTVDGIVGLASVYVVDSRDTAESAAAELRTLKAVQKQVTEKGRALSEGCHGLHKKALAVFRPLETQLGTGETHIKGQILTFEEGERRRAAEEARVERERFETEQRRLREEAAERQRQAEEAERLRRTAEDSGDIPLADALAEQASQLAEAAQERQIEAETIPTPVAKPLPKLAGITTSDRWSAEVTDLMELVKAVAAGTVPLRAIEANAVFLNQQAVSMKSDLNYPGVRAVSTPTLAGRAS